jgi:hypothetical protein
LENDRTGKVMKKKAGDILATDSIEARCGMRVKCTYRDHQFFDHTSNLCLSLHYVFIQYAPTVVAQNGYRLNRAIYIFFDYLTEHNSVTPQELRPTHFTDISVEILAGYQDFLKRKREPISNAEKLKSAIGMVAKTHGTIPLLLFPTIQRPTSIKTEPVSDYTYISLSKALMQHIDTLYKKIDFRNTVNESRPYNFCSHGTFARPGNIRVWQPDHARSLRTLLGEGFPMQIPLEDLRIVLSPKYVSSYEHDCDTTLKVLTYKYTRDKKFLNDGFDLDKLLDLYFPLAIDQAAIALFLLLQTGWNKESVINIDSNNFEHALAGTINEDLAIIFSEKYRAQGLDKPYDAPTQVTASSDKTDRYSIYNLILLAKDLSLPITGFAFDTSPFLKAWEERNDLFLFLRAWGDWFKNGSRHTSISVTRAYVSGVEHFLKKYEIYENAKRLTRASQLTTRLRPTWALHKKRTTALNIISSHFKHKDINTTDIYYDSSGAAMRERKQRLRHELENVVKLLVNRQFKGLLGRHANEIASAQVKIFTLPGMDRPLWGCDNQLSPDWPGYENHVPSGSKCFHLEKCLGCSRVRIYEDSLPYLMERLAHTDYELEIESEGSRTSDLLWEKQILEFLIDDCEDDEVIQEAIRYRRKHSPLLPHDMSTLRLIFDDGV